MAGTGRGGYLGSIQHELAGAARDELFLVKDLGRHGVILAFWRRLFEYSIHFSIEAKSLGVNLVPRFRD
jgi:hypothetical protein